jgi:hypothetical protein
MLSISLEFIKKLDGKPSIKFEISIKIELSGSGIKIV